MGYSWIKNPTIPKASACVGKRVDYIKGSELVVSRKENLGSCSQERCNKVWGFVRFALGENLVFCFQRRWRKQHWEWVWGWENFCFPLKFFEDDAFFEEGETNGKIKAWVVWKFGKNMRERETMQQSVNITCKNGAWVHFTQICFRKIKAWGLYGNSAGVHFPSVIVVLSLDFILQDEIMVKHLNKFIVL